MKSEMESMYSNKVWDLVEPPEGIKPMDVSGYIREREEQSGRWKPLKQGLL